MFIKDLSVHYLTVEQLHLQKIWQYMLKRNLLGGVGLMKEALKFLRVGVGFSSSRIFSFQPSAAKSFLPAFCQHKKNSPIHRISILREGGGGTLHLN